MSNKFTTAISRFFVSAMFNKSQLNIRNCETVFCSYTINKTFVSREKKNNVQFLLQEEGTLSLSLKPAFLSTMLNFNSRKNLSIHKHI